MANHSVIRISKELKSIQTSSDLSLAVACRDVDVKYVKALIVGPPDTPYEFGFFEFSIKFPRDYPTKPPSVSATTTNGGRCRFNPNIYATGKGMLLHCTTMNEKNLTNTSTWRGERGEEWSSAQGLESILISIQSLMSSNPYENEPGFEDIKSVEDKKNAKAYIQKIRHESLRISVIQRLEESLGITSDGMIMPPIHDSDSDGSSAADDPDAPWTPFDDLCKQRFLWYYDSYKLAITKAKQEVKDGQQFVSMPFEGGGNDMPGKFNYAELDRRLKAIKDRLEADVKSWVEDGLLAHQRQTGVSANLKRQFEQVVEYYKSGNATLDFNLENKNPFEWTMTYFGRPMTNLDGGLFTIKLYFSPRFPEEQPRVRFVTPMFHHRIATDGTPCYTAAKREDIKSHIEAIVEALEEEQPPYDPRTLVNPEASKLYWGSADDRKIYHRMLRRAVQRSTE